MGLNSKQFLQIYDLLFIRSEFVLFISAIDFNVVNPSNNTFNRQRIIITIFVNETKCHFEKNKKKVKKTTSKLTPKVTPYSTPCFTTCLNTNAYLSGTCKMRNEIETKRNKSKRNASKRNEIYRNETKSKRNEINRNEIDRNETKRNNSK